MGFNTSRHITPCYMMVYCVVYIALMVFQSARGSPPSSPQNVTITTVGKDILIEWSAPAHTYGTILHYKINYNILPSQKDVSIVVGKKLYALIGVSEHPGMLFRVSVMAENEDGLSRPSIPRYTRTSCGANLFLPAEDNTSISSFSYPRYVNPGSLCKWKVSTNVSYAIEIQIHDIDVSKTTNCSSSYIRLSVSGNHILKMCSMSQRRFSVTGNVLDIVFVVGIGSAGGRFKLDMRSIVPAPKPPSQVRLMSTHDVIRVTWQPPLNYNPNHVTSYIIKYSVFSEHRTIAVKISNRLLSYPIRTKGHKGQLFYVTLIALHNDEESRSAGPFYVRAACGNTIVLKPSEKHTITSPRYPLEYPPNVLCKWNIVTSTRLPLYFRIVSMDIQDTLFCNSDYISLSTWPNEKRKCGTIAFPEELSSIQSGFVITFVSDRVDEGKGFVLEVADSTVPLNQEHSTVHESRITSMSHRVSTSTTPSQNGEYTTEMSIHLETTDTTNGEITQSTMDKISVTKPGLASDNGKVNKTLFNSSQFPELKYTTDNLVKTDNITTDSQVVTHPTTGLSTQPEVTPSVYHSLMESSTEQISTPPLSEATSEVLHTSQSLPHSTDLYTTHTNNMSDYHTTQITGKTMNSGKSGELLSTRATEPTTVRLNESTSQHALDNDMLNYTEATTTDTGDHKSTVMNCTNNTLGSRDMNFFEPFINTSRHYLIRVSLILNKRRNISSSRDSVDKTSEKFLKTRLRHEIIPLFNNTTLFEDIEINKIGLTTRTSLPVSIAVYYNLSRVLRMTKDRHFSLISYINDTALKTLSMETHIVCDNWTINEGYVRLFSAAPIFVSQEINDQCQYLDEDVCGLNFTCVPHNPSTYGVVCCHRNQIKNDTCVAGENHSIPCRNLDRTVATSSSKTTLTVPLTVAVAVIFLIVSVFIGVCVCRRKRAQQTIPVDESCVKQNGYSIPVYEMATNNPFYFSKDNMISSTFTFNNRTGHCRSRSGSLQIDSAPRCRKADKEVEETFDKFKNFIEDKETLKNRLKKKQRSRRGQSV